MPRKFEEVVDRVARRIGQGRVLLSERVRAGRRRQISVGPYRTATSTKRQYAFCAFPALPGESDCKLYPGTNRAAREFVRFVGTEEAQDALVRESRKHGGDAPPTPKTNDADIVQAFGRRHLPR